MGTFSFKCTNCGKLIGAQDEWNGKQSVCPYCGKTVLIVKPVEGGGEAAGPPDQVQEWPGAPVNVQVSSELATKALYYALFSFFCCAFVSPFALLYGFRALEEIKNSEGRLSGRGTAITAIILAIISILAMCGNMVFSFLKLQPQINQLTF
ncbi:MAG: DUF4190 domain-containing protein [Lentisphaerae bacterium]|jgi:DNA-directed RNA polymerase subunit RPC12/RpoP|nr:DUF4190 domain-containing protein [Lentisphaerota bacterium]